MTNEENQALISRCRCRIELTEMILRNHRPGREMRKILETEMRVFQIALAALTAQPDDWQQRAEAAEAKLAELAKQEPGLFEWRFKDVEGCMPTPWTALGMDKLEQCRATFGDMVEYRFWHAAPVADLAELVPDGWKLVPVEPTEKMIVEGFESRPDEDFSDPAEWEKYSQMSGCQQAAYRAQRCWAAMLAAAPEAE